MLTVKILVGVYVLCFVLRKYDLRLISYKYLDIFFKL